MYKVALATAAATLFLVGGVASFAYAWPYDYGNGGGNSGNYGTFDYSAMASGVTCGVVHYCTTNYGYGYGGPPAPAPVAAGPCGGYYCNNNNDGQKVIINVNGGTANIFVNQGHPAYSTYSGYSGPDDDSTQTAAPQPYHNDYEQSYFGYGGPGG
jgi:hypothetical protein